MVTAITILAFVAVTLLVLGGYYALSPQTTTVADRLEQLKTGTTAIERRGEPVAGLRVSVERLMGVLGRVFQSPEKSAEILRRRLGQAGFYSPTALVNYKGIQLMAAVGLPLIFTAAMIAMGISVAGVIFALPLLGLAGFAAPALILDMMISQRKDRLQKSLADAVDLMVACVEAGLSLNAALVRVAADLKTAHPDIAQEFELCGLEMRAGKPREEAFRNLGQRTGVKDLQSFAAMLIQTDRFGTSIARALRVFADSLRTKRRQRAEEAAAKTTIKMVFPLVFFIFPAILVVLLGPGLLRVMEAFRAVSR
jgi:tight adherence protein C